MKTALIVVAAIVILAAVYWTLGRAWYSAWGATAAEIALRLPGDEIAPNANMTSTRALTVRAPAARIYPWLLQIGQGRGGMYSYEWLENLARCDIHNVYEIVPALQQVQVGHEIHMGPEGYPFYRIASFDGGSYFVLQPGDPATKKPGDASWAMVLQDQGNGTTRMIFRQRQQVAPGFANFVTWRVIVDPLSFVMEQKMMRTIRDLAERS